MENLSLGLTDRRASKGKQNTLNIIAKHTLSDPVHTCTVHNLMHTIC